mgnify:CR=1 FL=1
MTSSPLFPNQLIMVDPQFEDEALSALMEDAISEETKFDVEEYFNSDLDY